MKVLIDTCGNNRISDVLDTRMNTASLQMKLVVVTIMNQIEKLMRMLSHVMLYRMRLEKM